jgi:uncharacterized protein
MLEYWKDGGIRMTTTRYRRHANLFRGVGAALLLCAGFVRGEAEAPAKAANQGFFWRARSASATVYLLGSVHVGQREFYPMRAPIEKAFATSAVLAVEADMRPEKQADAMGAFFKAGMLPPGASLRGTLPADTRKRLDDYIAENAAAAALDRMRPWMAAQMISMLEMQKAGYQAEDGVDLHFLRRAAVTGKKIVELEGADLQLKIFTEMNPKTETMMLHQTLAERAEAPAKIRTIIQAWQSGDDDALRQVILDAFDDNKDMAPLKKALFTDRDEKMAAKIETFLQGTDTVFVVVGAGHLLGPESVVERLRKSEKVKTSMERM